MCCNCLNELQRLNKLKGNLEIKPGIEGILKTKNLDSQGCSTSSQSVSSPTVQTEHVLPTNEIATVYKAITHEILLGGDQLSQARARAAIKIKANGETPSSRLEGFIPTVEDWHTKLTFLKYV